MEPQIATTPPEETSSAPPPLSLQAYLIAVISERKVLYGWVGGGLLVLLVMLFIMPKTFTAHAVLMPPDDPKSQSLLLQSVSGVAGLNLPSSANTLSEELVEVIKSRRIRALVLSRAELGGIALPVLLEGKNHDENLTALARLTRVFSTKQRFITIDVSWQTGFFSFSDIESDSAKVFASRLVSLYLEALDETNRALVNQKSLYNATYLAEHVAQCKADLDSAYFRLERFQRANKAVSLGDQLQVQLQAASDMKAKLITSRLELDLLLKDRRETDPMVLELGSRVRELEAQYSKIALGRGDNFAIGFESLPSLSREYASLYREVKLQEELYALLMQIYYRERLQGFKDTPTIVILDSARTSDLRSSPKRGLSLLLGAIGFFSLGLLHIILRYRIRLSLSNPDLIPLRNALKSIGLTH